jgi:hypothetical protein
MSDVQLKPLFLALAASLLSLYFLVIVWPRFVAPDTAPFVERLLAEIRSQNYDCVYANLSDRWRRQSALRDLVTRKLRDEEQLLKGGGFVDATRVDPARVVRRANEALVPVTYRLKATRDGQPRVHEREVVVKLVYQGTRWTLDGIE